MQISNELSDQELLQRYRATEDASSLGVLFSRYKHLVYAVCMKYFKNSNDSEDAVMEIFEKLHLDLKRVEIAQFKGWLYMVARNHCLMHLRKAGLKVTHVEEFPSLGQEDLDMEELLDKEELTQRLEHSMSQLKPEHARCLRMFYIEDKSYKQIWQETGMSLNEIKSHIQNGKQNLKKILIKK